jgi:hypothetical protein
MLCAVGVFRLAETELEGQLFFGVFIRVEAKGL